MDPRPRHAWNLSPAEARALQRELAARVSLLDEPLEPRVIAGVDASYPRWVATGRAAIVALEWPTLRVLDTATFAGPAPFPYIPGLLSFREAPLVITAFEWLRVQPDLLLVDGQGIAHPRRLGIASHLGLWLDVPSIGVAKSRLFGVHPPVGDTPGDVADLRAPDGEPLGVVLRTRRGARPLYLSPGHRISIENAETWVRRLCRGYRLPEPTRLAHNAAGTTAA